MQKNTKKFKRLMLSLLLSLTILSPIASSVSAKSIQINHCSYHTITTVEDWGASIPKIIIKLDKKISKKSITKDTFKVYVTREDKRLDKSLIDEGYREVTTAYICDKNGNSTNSSSKYVALEMQIGPNIQLSSAINYDIKSNFNNWVNCKYTITQQKDIQTKSGAISNLVINKNEGNTRVLVDKFKTGKFTYSNTSLTYASYKPANNGKKRPLIIWLHGLGEGGTDATIPISANKADNFVSKDMQAYFHGAYVLVPQTPGRWMDGFKSFGDGTSVYENALISLIKNYIHSHNDIDTNRIYIGGDSNGGYMTMLMIRDYPKYFAAAFPTCEALSDNLISDADINKIKNLPIWFTAAKTDPVVDPSKYVLPTYNRLIKAGAKDVNLSYFDNVVDTSGLYKKQDGTPYEYNGHWSWIYVLNNQCTKQDSRLTIMQWLSKKSLKK
ncbi:prolyl oligopeptidase family serine peptidase [Clostridium felsineum]|uniref:prolyl oligopeptidase family serine peptidase n=1 Tax=Clostridium felsineum TaxID=36839 RepID=UPI00098C3F48|nr:prolyl oligopeptidase family serine peptidase [Clostridium felsineum]URZ17514.1 hypothetical protein CLFE_035670 [Clostridium felsineum DSM 794]